MDKKIRIIIVEDEVPMAKALEFKFSRHGFDVTVCHNGEDALKQFELQEFDYAIIDLIMPKLNGYELISQLKSMGIKTPFLIASNLSQRSNQLVADELGADDYIIKANSTLDQIINIVESRLKANQLVDFHPE